MRTTTRGSHIGLALTCLAVPLIAAGCSNEAVDPATTIKIGLITETSGTFAPEGEGVPEVAQAWVDWVNDEFDGIAGRKVEIVLKDSESQPAVAASAARELVEREQVAMIAVESGLAQPAIWDYLESKQIPLIGTDNGTRNDDTPSTVFTTDLGFPEQAQAGPVVAKLVGADSIASAVCSEIAACKGIGTTLGDFAPTAGVDYKGGVTVAATATDVTAQCLEIVDSGAEVLANFLVAVPAKRLIDTCVAQGYQGQFLQVSVNEHNFDKLGDGPMLGVSYDFPWWSDAEPVVKYREVMETYDVPFYQSFQNSNLWASLELFRKAMENEGPGEGEDVTGASIIEALRAGVQDETLGGLLAQPLTFAEDSNTRINCFWAIKRAADGTFTTLSGEGESGNGVKGDLASVCI